MSVYEKHRAIRLKISQAGTLSGPVKKHPGWTLTLPCAARGSQARLSAGAD